MKCKGFVNNNSVLYPLVENCVCPYKAKIEELLGQFILFVQEEPTAVNHKKDKASILIKKHRSLFRRCLLLLPTTKYTVN